MRAMATLIADPLSDPLYYLKHFDFMLDSLEVDRERFLSASQQATVERLQRLPIQARCLFIRLYLRKGNFFRTDKLDYSEIGDLNEAIHHLIKDGFLSRLSDERLDLSITMRNLAELKEEGLLQHLPSVLAGRPNIDQALLSQIGSLQVPRLDIIQLQHRNLIDRCQLAYFGNAHQDLSDLILTDLGQRSFESTQCTTTKWRSQIVIDLASLLLVFRREIDHLSSRLKGEKDCEGAKEHLGAMLEQLLEGFPARPNEPLVQRRYDRTVVAGGRLAERLDANELALKWYALSEASAIVERRLRVMSKLNITGTEALAEQLLDSSLKASEIKYAERLLGRPAHYLASQVPEFGLSLNTEMLNSYEGGIERRVIDWLHDHRGQTAHHTENTVFSGLFGLLFWDAIFAPIDGAFFHPYQSSPADLFDADFYPRRERLFQDQFKKLGSKRYRDERLVTTIHEKQGIQNPFVVWSEALLMILIKALETIHWSRLEPLFQLMARNPREATRGFPDLIVLGEDSVEFIEVKGPGDRLQDHQIRWLCELNNAGIPSSVLKVTP